MEAPSVFPEELLNICPVVYQALQTLARDFQSGNGQSTNLPPWGALGILTAYKGNYKLAK